jgi:hypothetical protein
LFSNATSELWLGTNSNPASTVLIASVPGNPQSSLRSLVAGQKYYVEVLHKVGIGNDNISVPWQGPSISQQVIDGLYCRRMVSISGISPIWPSSREDRDRNSNVWIDDLATFAEEWLSF